MGLADYYIQQRQFSQAMYIIFTALDILPREAEDELKASLHIMMGNILKEFLDYNITLIKTQNLEKRDANEISSLEKFINTQILVFSENGVIFPKNKLAKNAAEIATIFKMAMTQYNKAAEIFVLDGYVTEHVQIVKQKSNLYKLMATLEDSEARKYAMGTKRNELIAPLFEKISSKHFIGMWRVIIFLRLLKVGF